MSSPGSPCEPKRLHYLFPGDWQMRVEGLTLFVQFRVARTDMDMQFTIDVT